jgi:archaetidylinositol phosphate synthase
VNSLIDQIRKPIKGVMGEVAGLINEASGGRIKPNHITVVSLLGHILVVVAIINNQLSQAALLLIVFGLLDVTDGALARIQKLQTNSGILYDAVSDRIKEVFLYTALAYWMVENEGLSSGTITVLALGTSFLSTYVRTKGQAILVSLKKISPVNLNRTFGGGLMRFEIRMFLIVIGLLTGYIVETLITIIVLSIISTTGQLYQISTSLDKIRK